MSAPVQGQQFDPDEEKILQEMTEHWRTVWNDTPVQTIARVEEAAKQMILVTTGLQGLYLALFVFSSIRAQVLALPGGVLILILFFTPLVCWLVSLFYATRVFVPRVQPGINFNEVSASAWQQVKDAYARVSEEKLRWLQYSHRWLLVSFLLVLCVMIVFLLLPAAPTGPTQIIIVTPTPTHWHS